MRLAPLTEKTSYRLYNKTMFYFLFICVTFESVLCVKIYTIMLWLLLLFSLLIIVLCHARSYYNCVATAPNIVLLFSYYRLVGLFLHFTNILDIIKHLYFILHIYITYYYLLSTCIILQTLLYSNKDIYIVSHRYVGRYTSWISSCLRLIPCRLLPIYTRAIVLCLLYNCERSLLLFFNVY